MIHLPSEMHVEILKNLDFRECLKCQMLSSYFRDLIIRNHKYLKSLPIYQLFVTHDKIRVNFENSKNVWVLDLDEAPLYLHNATVTVLWVELTNDVEPIEFLNSIFSFNFRIGNLKLGSCKTQCDIEKLENFMASKNCQNLIIDRRFNINSGELNASKLKGLTLSQNEVLNVSLDDFKGTWLELGPNDLTTQNVVDLILRWKSGNIPKISQYNISVNGPEILEKLQQICICIEFPRTFQIFREQDILDVEFRNSTEFSNHLCVIIKEQLYFFPIISGSFAVLFLSPFQNSMNMLINFL